MDFLAFKDLIKVITRNKIKNIEILGYTNKKKPLTEELYDAVIDKDFETEEEAAAYFYPGDSGGLAKIRKVRWRLVRQLVNLIFFIDNKESKFSERNNAYFNAYRDLAAAKIMIAKSASKAGIFLLHDVFEKSQQYEFTELCAESCRSLREIYARSGSDKEYLTLYTDLHRKFEEKRQQEYIAFDYYEELISYYFTKNVSNKQIHQKASDYHRTLSGLIHEVDTSQFYFHTYNISLIKYMSNHEYRKAFDICEEALDVFNKRSNLNRGSTLAIAIQKLSCLTQLRLFETYDKSDFLAFCIELTDEGSFNWFKVLDMQVYYCIYTKQYETALEIVALATSHSRYKLLNGVTSEIWQLHAGYLHLLAKLGRLDAQKVEQVAGEFKYSKFMNQFKAIESDKEGMNIPLVLFPVLYNLAIGNDLEYGRSLEALDKYRQRYLSTEANRRSAYFMKALVALSKKPFEPVASERKIQYEINELKKIPPEDAARFFVVEIVPYEDLWEMLIS